MAKKLTRAVNGCAKCEAASVQTFEERALKHERLTKSTKAAKRGTRGK